jgi:hypothetical protein
MADGFRILENGDLRLTESSDSRITENFIEASSSLAALGSKVSSGVGVLFGANDLTASGSIAPLGLATIQASVSIQGAGSSLNVGYQTFPTAASLTASTSIAGLGDVKIIANAAVSATGNLVNQGLRIQYADSSLSTAGSQIAAAEKTLFGVISAEDFETTRILENGDVRVTEAGDTRIVFDKANNIVGSIVSEPTHTVFTSTAYYNDDDTWKTFIPYVKYGGAWKDNVRIYKNQNGTWKRSY